MNRVADMMQDSWAVLCANAVLVLGGVVLGWSVETLLLLLWVEVVAVGLVGAPLYLMISQRRPGTIVSGLLIYIVLAAQMVFHVADDILEAWAWLSQTGVILSASALMVAVFLILHEVDRGLRTRRVWQVLDRSREDRSGNWADALIWGIAEHGYSALRCLIALAPSFISLLAAVLAVQEGWANGYAVVVSVKIAVTLALVLYTRVDGDHPLAAVT